MIILKTWLAFQRIPLIGRFLFRFAVRRFAPYSSSIYPDVEKLELGFARASMRDRKCLRNPFQSVHAIALANLGELVTGLAVLTAMPAGRRGIVNAFTIHFHKKARGRISCECRTAFPDQDGPFQVKADLVDGSGVRVADVIASWEIGSARKGAV
ncbi:MAG: DUF4442 domain-containing protein [Deltaproteobacteria bacterium]|nr:DUF4442 domain-containing protein [Deltaproteobacteria bacterium]MBI3295392.1 DUF4442 domain-containing protein [Deltaproteobacteria bacterium]